MWIFCILHGCDTVYTQAFKMHTNTSNPLFISDSFEVSVNVVFLKMTTQLPIFSFSSRNFASVIRCAWSEIAQVWSHPFCLPLWVSLIIFCLPELFRLSLHFCPVIQWSRRRLEFDCQREVASSWWRCFLGCQAALWSLRGAVGSSVPRIACDARWKDRRSLAP